jgi:hypothetical protein
MAGTGEGSRPCQLFSAVWNVSLWKTNHEWRLIVGSPQPSQGLGEVLRVDSGALKLLQQQWWGMTLTLLWSWERQVTERQLVQDWRLPPKMATSSAPSWRTFPPPPANHRENRRWGPNGDPCPSHPSGTVSWSVLKTSSLKVTNVRQSCQLPS